MGNVKMQKIDLCVIQDDDLAQVFLDMDQRPAVKTVVVIDQIVPPNSPKVSALHKALREKAEKEGLDLNVIDHYNGTERSVKTLSGGESFQASLSLALGLSDEIQAGAGGIRLDAMFVDEGFGSLDEESIDQAMKALLSLVDGNRLVGIISHVADLKNRIDKQIVVTKEKSGGSNANIVT